MLKGRYRPAKAAIKPPIFEVETYWPIYRRQFETEEETTAFNLKREFNISRVWS